MRHTPPGTTIRLDAAKTGQGVRVGVTDDGPGIPQEEREAVLRRFHRLERSRTMPGNGLGLSLIAAVVELHGAALRLKDARPGLRVVVDFLTPARGRTARGGTRLGNRNLPAQSP